MNMKHQQAGAINPLMFSLVMSVVLLVISVGFGAWAYVSRQDYKNNTDQKIEQAVAVAVERTKTEKDNEFIEREKEPLKQYKVPSDLGSISLSYPKTWSGQAEVKDGTGVFIFHPDVINIAEETVYALKISVENTSYEEEVLKLDQQVREGKAKAVVYKLPKVPNVLGVRINGEIGEGKQGSMIMLPLRDKTIKISTESQSFLGDFNKFILPNLSFSP